MEMTLHQILEEAEKEFYEEFVTVYPDQDPDFATLVRPSQVQDYFHSTSIKLIEAIIEQMKGAKLQGKKDWVDEISANEIGYNQALDHQISLLTEQLLAIKGK